MIVCLYLDKHVNRLVDELVLTVRCARHEPRPGPALEHGGIVAVSGDHTVGRLLGRRLDHAEEALVLALAVDCPARVENLVTAVLGVRLRKHHQLGIGRVAVEIFVATDEVVDLLLGQREAQIGIRRNQRIPAGRAQWNRANRRGLVRLEQRLDAGNLRIHGLGHAIEQHVTERHHVLVTDS